MTRDEWRDAIDETIGDVTRKWLGVQRLGRDREVTPASTARLTAYLQAHDSWERGDVVLGAGQLVWQPFPQGPPQVYAGPLRLEGEREGSRDGIVELRLATGNGVIGLRLATADARALTAALGD